MTENTKKNFGFGTQIKKSPFFKATLDWGAKDFSVYNHMYIPRDFGNPTENFWNLINNAILCDVSVERQVEISGPDAFKFVQYLTPRNISDCAIGQCKYIVITDENGGILNDPVLLRLDENHFWLSLADSDILLWAKGVAINSGHNVFIREPDVSPLQLQGPKSREIMETLFGSEISQLRYYWLKKTRFLDIPLVISRTGWSSELGYEIFLCDGSQGELLWNTIMDIGSKYGLKAGHTSTIRRIEGGMLSYHADLDINSNPYEVGLGRLVDLNMETNFIGKEALKKIFKQGVKRKQVGLLLDCKPLIGPNTEFWPIKINNQIVGKVTSAIYSPRLEMNIALAMVKNSFSSIGTCLEISIGENIVQSKVVEVPFFDPKKKIAKSPNR